MNSKFQKVVNSVYSYIDVDDPDKCKMKLDNVLEFVIRLRHSYIDNDKPQSAKEINEKILEIANREGLSVAYVELE